MRRLRWMVLLLLLLISVSPSMAASPPTLPTIHIMDGVCISPPPSGEILRLGRGTVTDAAWRPDGKVIAVSGSLGIWLYTDNFADIAFMETEDAQSIAWSPDGTRVAVGKGDGTVEIWDAVAHRCLQSFQIDKQQDSAAIMVGIFNRTLVVWSPDGKKLAAISTSDSIVHIFDLANFAIPTTFDFGTVVLSLAWSPDSKYLVAGSSTKKISVRNATTGQIVTTFDKHTAFAPSAVWSPNGKQILSAGSDVSGCGHSQTSPGSDAIWLWDAATGQAIHKFESDICSAEHPVAWDSGGYNFAVTNDSLDGSKPAFVRIWNVALNKVMTELPADGNEIAALAWEPNGARLLGVLQPYQGCRCGEGGLILWDALAGTTIRVFKPEGHTSGVNTVSWSPDGKHIASGGNDSFVRLWDTATGQLQATLQQAEVPNGASAIDALAWSPDGAKIAAIGCSGWSVWDVKSQQLLFKSDLTCYQTPSTLLWSPDGGKLIVTFGAEVQVWDAHSGQLLTTYTPSNTITYAEALYWDIDHLRLITGGSEYQPTTLWDLTSPSPVSVTLPENMVNPIWLVSWRPDGKRLATVSDVTVKIWDGRSGQLVLTLTKPAATPDDYLTAIAWRPDGQVFAAGMRDKVWLWDAVTGQLLTSFRTGEIRAMTWSPDGQEIATANADSTVRVWKVGNLRLRF